MKLKLKILLFLTAICQLLSANCFALDLGFAREDGGRPGAFLSYGAGARSLAMGKTFVGVADDASTIYWNPAGLANLQNPEITALYASMYEKTGYSFAAGVYPLNTAGRSPMADDRESLGTIGVALVNLSSRGFQLRDEYNYELGEGGVSETAAIVSYGKQLPFAVGGSPLAVGANIKIVNQNIDSRSDTGYGIDLGALWRADGGSQTADDRLGQVLKPLSIGLSIQNLIAPKLTLIEDTDKYPLSSTLGFSYWFFSNKLLTAVDLNKTENRQLKVHLGTEYTLARLFSIRAGLDETEATFGLGVKWQNYSLDYAFAYHDAWKGYEDLGISHRFGLTMRWGKTKQIAANRYEIAEKSEKQIAADSSELVVEIEKYQGTPNDNLVSTNSSLDSEWPTAAVAATPQVMGASVYTVKKGDCLWNIAGRAEIYNNSWNWILIYKANKGQIKNPDLIYPGQVLNIPLKH